jgi:hypothetical protein
MSNICPVVTIETENGPVEINESDFDPKNQELYSEEKEPKEGTVDWYKSQLDELGIDWSEANLKDDYIALYDEHKESE